MRSIILVLTGKLAHANKRCIAHELTVNSFARVEM